MPLMSLYSGNLETQADIQGLIRILERKINRQIAAGNYIRTSMITDDGNKFVSSTSVLNQLKTGILGSSSSITKSSSGSSITYSTNGYSGTMEVLTPNPADTTKPITKTLVIENGLIKSIT